MAKIIGNEIAKQICEILGLDYRQTKNITIKLEANNAVLIIAEQYMRSCDTASILRVFQSVNWLEANADE